MFFLYTMAKSTTNLFLLSPLGLKLDEQQSLPNEKATKTKLNIWIFHPKHITYYKYSTCLNQKAMNRLFALTRSWKQH